MRTVRSQRILILTALLATAWLLHVNACEWAYKREFRDTAPILTLWTHSEAGYAPFTPPVGAAPATLPPPGTLRYAGAIVTGLFAQGDVNRLVAVVVGIIAQLALLITGGYLWLGWRWRARVERGRCWNCNYDLRGRPDKVESAEDFDTTRIASRCPECGLRQPSLP